MTGTSAADDEIPDGTAERGDTRGAEGPPPGWLLAGSHPKHYEVGVDQQVAPGSRSGYLRARESPQGFGTLMQMFTADASRGTRLRFSAKVRAEEVENWAALWMRVDGPHGKTRAFDNMGDRPIVGTVDWHTHHVVLDAADDAVHVALGVLLDGPGTVWIGDISFEEVDGSVPVTGKDPSRTYPAGPVNLDFMTDTAES